MLPETMSTVDEDTTENVTLERVNTRLGYEGATVNTHVCVLCILARAKVLCPDPVCSGVRDDEARSYVSVTRIGISAGVIDGP